MNVIEISVVIPIYNSSNSIEEVVRRTKHTLEKANLSFEIILVDDYSLDDSLLQLKKLQEQDNRVHIIPLLKNYGQQGALKEGIKKAKGEYVITMDDDLEHQPEDIIRLIAELKKGHDVVYVIPQNKKYPLHRKFGSKLVDIFFTICLRKPSNCKVSSYRILKRYVVDQIVQDNTPFVYITALTLKITQNIGNIEGYYIKRKYGKSNYNISKLVKLFMKLFYYYA